MTNSIGTGHRQNGMVHGFSPSLLRIIPTKPIASFRRETAQIFRPSHFQSPRQTITKTQIRNGLSSSSSSLFWIVDHQHHLPRRQRTHNVLSSSRGDYGYDDDDDIYEEEESTSRGGRRRRTVTTTTTKTQRQQNDILDAADELEDDGFWDDDDEDDDFFDDDDEDDEDGIFGNVIIPNPLLDSMDPDGAADRFPELARDWRFWVDMVLFITVLDFLRELGTGGDIARYLQDMQEVLPPTFPQ